MARLGYERYGAQGGDWGAFVSPELGRIDPDHVVGVHLNAATLGFIPFGPVDPDELASFTDAEKARLERLDTSTAGPGNGYFEVQATRPQTLAYALTDSPVGQLAWIVEKFKEWTDAADVPEDAVDRDQLLTNVMLYWLTGTADSSARLYYENTARRLLAASSPARPRPGWRCSPSDYAIRRYGRARQQHRPLDRVRPRRPLRRHGSPRPAGRRRAQLLPRPSLSSRDAAQEEPVGAPRGWRTACAFGAIPNWQAETDPRNTSAAGVLARTEPEVIDVRWATLAPLLPRDPRFVGGFGCDDRVSHRCRLPGGALVQADGLVSVVEVVGLGVGGGERVIDRGVGAVLEQEAVADLVGMAVGSLPARGRPPQAAARRAGLEFVEKLLPTNLTSTDTTERDTGMLPLPCPARRIACRGRSQWCYALPWHSVRTHPCTAALMPGHHLRRRLAAAPHGRHAQTTHGNRFHKAGRPGSIEHRRLHRFPPQR